MASLVSEYATFPAAYTHTNIHVKILDNTFDETCKLVI